MLRLDFQKPRRVSLRRHKKEPPRLQVKGSNSPASCKPQRLLLMVLYANLIQKSIFPLKIQHNRNNSSAGSAIGRNAVFSCFAKLRGIRRQRCWRRAAAHLPCRSTAWLGCAMRSLHLAMAKCLQSNRSVSRAAHTRPKQKSHSFRNDFLFWQMTLILIEDAPPSKELHPLRLICTPTEVHYNLNSGSQAVGRLSLVKSTRRRNS